MTDVWEERCDEFSAMNVDRGVENRCVVSVTPAALRSDSRTLKQAASLARAGARSIVVEGLMSGRDFSPFDIEVLTVSTAIPGGGLPVASIAPSQVAKARITALKNYVRKILPTIVIEFGLFLLTLWSLFRAQWGRIFFLLPDADLYILHSFHFWPAIFLKSRFRRVNYIYDAHDFYREMNEVEGESHFTRKWMLPLYSWMDRKAVRYAAAVMTVSEGVADLYARADRISPIVFQNVHDHRNDRSPTRSLRSIIGVSDNVFLIVAVGNAKSGASMEPLFNALELVDSRIQIVFVGKGFAAEKARDWPAQLTNRVHFVDAVPADEVVPFIAGADCAIILYYALTENYNMALPNRFFQSVAAGIPLLYPKLQEMQRVAGTAHIGIAFDPQDSNDIVRAISHIYGDENLRKRLVEETKKAAKKLCWEAEESRFLCFVGSKL